MSRQKQSRACVELDWKADTGPLHQLIDDNPGDKSCCDAADRLFIGLLAHWPNATLAAAKEALTRAPDEDLLGARRCSISHRPFVEGVIARMTNDEQQGAVGFYCCARGAGENRPGSTRLRPGVVRARCNRCRSRAERGGTCAKAGARSSFFPWKRTQSMVSHMIEIFCDDCCVGR